MSFRVTPHRQFELGQRNSLTHYAKGAVLQEQLSTGSRINRPSDDPSGQKVVLAQQSLVNQYKTRLESVATARNVLSDAQVQVLDAQQVLVKAKDIALQARQTTDQSERDVFIQELETLQKQLESIANSQSNGRYLFGGTQGEGPPFQFSDSGGAVYQGSAFSAKIDFPGHSQVQTYYNGKDVFQPVSSGPLAISGSTGIASGTGTSSGSMTNTLIIQHTQTTYASGSGVQAGGSSVAGDTIVGAAGIHTLTIHDTSGNGTSGTISLNGGQPVEFTSTDGDLMVIGPTGEKVFINTQNITHGFNGTVQITATGTLSIDGGATSIPIDFSTNQTLSLDSPAVVRHFDTSNLKFTGTVQVFPESTSDVFQVIRQLRDAIENPLQLSAAEVDAAIERSLGDLDAAGNQLLKVVGAQSVDLQFLESLDETFQQLSLNANTLLGETKSTDYASAILQLQEQQNLLQFTLHSISTMNQISLIDFL